MNWGRAITLAFVAFMSFIGSMVYIAFTRDADLIRDDYYENELAFDQTKEKRNNFLESGMNIVVAQNEYGVEINFPENTDQNVEGKIFFYRPDKKKYDRQFALNLNESKKQILEYKHFKEGYYDLSIEWSQGSKSYLFEDDISFN